MPSSDNPLLQALLLDRDGTLNVDIGSPPSPQDIVLLPGVAEGLRRFRDAGAQFFIVTNHASIGRGKDTEKNHAACMDRLLELLAAEGVTIRGYRTCPHASEAQCSCRKPGTGMWESLRGEFTLDPAACLVVGDKDTDILLGKAIGARTARILSEQYPQTVTADYTIADLSELADLLL